MRVSIRDAKARLSEYLERARAGETVVVCRRNEPIAELRAIHRRESKPVLGNPVAGLRVPASFFEPLPKEIEDAFSGQAPDVP